MLRNALIPERRFYRVLRESKLFFIDFGAAAALQPTPHTDAHARNGAEILQAPVSLAESDYKVVRIEEMTKLAAGRVGASSSLSSSASASSLSSGRSRGQNGTGQALDRRGECGCIVVIEREEETDRRTWWCGFDSGVQPHKDAGGGGGEQRAPAVPLRAQ